MTIRVAQYKDTKNFYYDLRFKLGGKPIRERTVKEGKTEKQTYQAAVDRKRDLEKAYEESGVPKQLDLGPTLTAQRLVYMSELVAKPATEELKQSNFNKWLIPELGSKKLMEITTAEINKLRKKLSEHLGVKATNTVLGTLSACLHHAIRAEAIKAMPCKIQLLKDPKKKYPPIARTMFWDHEELDKLLNAAGDGHLVMLLLGADAGLRAGEIAGFEWTDIDWSAHELTVNRRIYRGKEGLPKSGKTRVIPMTKRLERALKAHRHLRGPRVLYQEDGQCVTRNVLSKWLKAIEEAAGLLAKGKLHKLRHTFCSLMAKAGVHATVIKELADHFSITVTEQYMWLGQNAKADAVARFESGAHRATEMRMAASS